MTRKTIPWSIKASCKTDHFDEQVTLDADSDESNRLTSYPNKAQNHAKMFTPDGIELRFTQINFTAQQLGIFSKREWTNSIDKMKYNQIADDAAEKTEVNKFCGFSTPSKITSSVLTFSEAINKIFQ